MSILRDNEKINQLSWELLWTSDEYDQRPNRHDDETRLFIILELLSYFLGDPNYGHSDIHLPQLLSTAGSTRLNWWPACFLRYYGDPRYLQCRWLRVVSWCWWTSWHHTISTDTAPIAPHRQTDGRLKCGPGCNTARARGSHRRKAAPARPAIAKTGKTEINVPQMLDSELWGQKGQHSGCLRFNTSSQRGGVYFLNIFTIVKQDWRSPDDHEGGWTIRSSICKSTPQHSM